jgi:hypothetical protein
LYGCLPLGEYALKRAKQKKTPKEKKTPNAKKIETKNIKCYLRRTKNTENVSI